MDVNLNIFQEKPFFTGTGNRLGKYRYLMATVKLKP